MQFGERDIKTMALPCLALNRSAFFLQIQSTLLSDAEKKGGVTQPESCKVIVGSRLRRQRQNLYNMEFTDSLNFIFVGRFLLNLYEPVQVLCSLDGQMFLL